MRTDEIERASNRVAAVVAYFPPVKLSEFLELKNRFPALEFDPKLADSVSPLEFVTADDAPTLLVHGDKDDLVKLDQSRANPRGISTRKSAKRIDRDCGRRPRLRRRGR